MNNFQFFLGWVGEHPFIFMGSLFLVLLFLEGVVKMIYYTVNKNESEDEQDENLCPHGYKDWDKCPDCCH